MSKHALIWPDPDPSDTDNDIKPVRNYDEDAPPFDFAAHNRCRYCKQQCPRATTTGMFKECANVECAAKRLAAWKLRYADANGGGTKGPCVSTRAERYKVKPARSGKK